MTTTSSPAPTSSVGGMSLIVNDEQLTAVFAAAGKEYGYDQVDAEFTTFKDFKVRWQRSCRWAEFKVSDYLVGAPYEVLQDLAYTLFSVAICNGSKKLETTALRDWVTADGWAAEHRPIFHKRVRNVIEDPKGKHHDLNDSLDRLREMWLIEDRDIAVSWMRDTRKVAAKTSVLMKSVMVNTMLDSDSVPDYVIDYVVYVKAVRCAMAKETFGNYDGYDFEPYENRFPNADLARCWFQDEGWVL